MFNTMKTLIEAKYYKTREEALEKVNTFYATEMLTKEEYSELMILINEQYPTVEEIKDTVEA